MSERISSWVSLSPALIAALHATVFAMLSTRSRTSGFPDGSFHKVIIPHAVHEMYHDLRLKRRMDWFCSGCNWQLLYNILEYRRVRFLLGG